MNPFAWLRKSIADSIYAGWQEGFAQIERELAGDGDQASRVPAVSVARDSGERSSPAAERPAELLASPISAAPLAAFVEQLRIASSGPSEAPRGGAEGGSPRKPGRPRKHNP